MPGLEELECYFRGLWMLLKGKRDGMAWLDFSTRGFWRSWWAVFFCLPPIILGWLAFRQSYMDALPKGTRMSSAFFAELALMDAANWVVPTALLVMISIGTGLSRFVIPIVVTINWLSVPMQWLYAIQNAIQLLIPESGDAMVFLFLVFLIISVMAHYLVLRAITGDALVPLAMVLCLYIGSFLTQYQLMTAFDLWLEA